jgi:hypothetical protein
MVGLCLEGRSRTERVGQARLQQRASATIDGDNIAAPILAETAALTPQQTILVTKRDELEARRAGWVTSQRQLNDLESWCRLRARTSTP